jgi:hypothetical protein
MPNLLTPTPPAPPSIKVLFGCKVLLHLSAKLCDGMDVRNPIDTIRARSMDTPPAVFTGQLCKPRHIGETLAVLGGPQVVCIGG